MMEEKTTNAWNVIKYSETKDGRNFEACFSDGAAANVVAMFSRFLGMNLAPSSAQEGSMERDAMFQAGIPASTPAHTSSPAPIPAPTTTPTPTSAPAPAPTPSNPESEVAGINRIFKQKGDAIVLSVKNLKAKNKTDQQARVCLLYLLYCQENGLGDVSRDNLYSYMRSEKLYSDGFRSWMSRNHAYFSKSRDQIELSYEGEIKAKAFLREVFDDAIEPAKTLPSIVSSMPAKARTAKAKKTTPPQVIGDLDLAPENAESLRDFMARHHYRESSMQLNVLFVYYLKVIRKMQQIDQNHIYTCYRHMGVKLPKNLYHALADTISRNRWLVNLSDLDLTMAGINVVEQTMRIK